MEVLSATFENAALEISNMEEAPRFHGHVFASDLRTVNIIFEGFGFKLIGLPSSGRKPPAKARPATEPQPAGGGAAACHGAFTANGRASRVRRVVP